MMLTSAAPVEASTARLFPMCLSQVGFGTPNIVCDIPSKRRDERQVVTHLGPHFCYPVVRVTAVTDGCRSSAHDLFPTCKPVNSRLPPPRSASSRCAPERSCTQRT